MLKLQIILGTTRPGRHADEILNWLKPVAEAHGKFELEVLDLRDWPLPIFQETFATLGDRKNPTYSLPVVKQWNQKIAEGDAFLMITSEYNHSITGALKNAIDNVFMSFAFRHKPLGMLGYSVGNAGGARALEHLASIAFELDMHALRDTVLLPEIAEFAKKGPSPMANAALQVMLDDLAWWGDVLKAARPTQLPPGNFRVRALVAEKK